MNEVPEGLDAHPAGRLSFGRENFAPVEMNIRHQGAESRGYYGEILFLRLCTDL